MPAFLSTSLPPSQPSSLHCPASACSSQLGCQNPRLISAMPCFQACALSVRTLPPADYAPPKPQPARSARQGATAGQQQGASASTPGGLPARAAGAAGSALQGAGSRLFPLLGQLYSQAAGTLIGELYINSADHLWGSRLDNCAG